VAKDKINSGINWLAFNDLLNLNFRVNYVGERKVPSSNGYFTGNAPSYTKANMTLTLNNLKKHRITPQLIIKNVFDEKYYGVGRQSGSSVASDYDPATNPNPPGFIPAYHPQPGRTVYLNVKMEF
jgi:outer membrane receptor protein involved in Fe transport